MPAPRGCLQAKTKMLAIEISIAKGIKINLFFIKNTSLQINYSYKESQAKLNLLKTISPFSAAKVQILPSFKTVIAG